MHQRFNNGYGKHFLRSYVNEKIDKSIANRPKKLIQAKGNKAIFIECDIKNLESLDGAISIIKSKFKNRWKY